MPIYVYHCKECNCEFELFQSIKAEPITECELGHSVYRVIQPVLGFVDQGITTVGRLAEVNTKKMGESALLKQEQLKKEQNESREKGRQLLEAKTGKKILRPSESSDIPDLPSHIKTALKSGDSKRVEKYLYEGT